MTRNPHRFLTLPLLPLTAALVAGAVAGGMASWVIRGAVSLSFFFLLLLAHREGWLGVPGKALWAVSGCFLVAFFSVYTLLHPVLPKNHVSRFAGKTPWIIEGRVLPPLDPGLTHTQVTVRTDALLTHNQRRIPVCGRLRVTVWGPYTQTVFVGDRIRFVSAIRRLHPVANPYGFDYRRFLAFRRVYATAQVKGFSRIVVLREARDGSWRGIVNRMRQHLNRWITATIPAPYHSLAAAFLIGYRGQVPPALREVFVRSGTVHLIAISGLHLGIVSILLFLFFRQILRLFPRVFLYVDIHRMTAVLTIGFLLLYLMLTGGRISTIRAFIMAAAFLGVLFFRRTARFVDLLLLAAFVILFFQPKAVFYVSFQLTFAAVAGILMGISRREFDDEEKSPGKSEGGMGRKALRWTGSVFLITLLAMGATFPIATSHFHQTSPMALAANLFGIPYVGFVMLPLGLVSLALYPFSPFLATILLRLDGGLIRGLVEVLRVLARFPYARVYVFPPRWYEIILYYGIFVSLIAAFRAGPRGGRRRYFAFAGAGVIFLGLSFVAARGLQKPTVTLFSVREGTYVAASRIDGHAALICDGMGGSLNRDDATWVLVPYLLHRRVTDLDFLVVANNEPVNLRAAGEVVAYKQPKYVVGPPPVLYSLKAILPRDYPGITWVENPSDLRIDGMTVMMVQRGRQRPGRRKTVDTVLSFGGLRIIVPSPRGRGISMQTPPQPTFLITSTFHSFHEKPPGLGKNLYIVRYHRGNWGRKARGTRKGFYDLRRDGAVVMERRGNAWHVRTFLSHRSCVISLRDQ